MMPYSDLGVELQAMSVPVMSAVSVRRNSFMNPRVTRHRRDR